MKTNALVLLGTAMLVGVSARGAVVFADTFNYPNGNLTGQGGWTYSTGSGTAPQVNGGEVVLSGNAQVAAHNFESSVISTAGSSVYYAFTLRVTSASSTASLITQLSSGFDNNQYSRIYLQSSGGGYKIGITSGNSASPIFGSSALTYGTSYRVVFAHDFVQGTANDAAFVWVDPVLSSRDNASAYLNVAGLGNDPSSFGQIRLRQSVSGTTAALDDLAIATSYTEAASISAVPEPTTTALAIFAGAALGVTAVRKLRQRSWGRRQRSNPHL